MERAQNDLPPKPSGFEDYLTAASQVVDSVVGRPQPDLIHTPGLINDMHVASLALATLDQLLAEPEPYSSSDLLTYTFAYELFMKDTAANNTERYSEMLGAVSVVSRLEQEYSMLSKQDRSLVQLDQLMLATADALGDACLESYMRLAEAKVAKDTKARRIFRRAAVFLGLLDEEENSVKAEPEDFSEWSLRTHLFNLAVARQRIIAGSNPIRSEGDSKIFKDSDTAAVHSEVNKS